MKVKTTKVNSENSDALNAEVNTLFRSANSHRNGCGVTCGLQKGFLRSQATDNEGGMTEFINLNVNNNPDCGCVAEKQESCAKCEEDLIDACSSEDFCKTLKSVSPYSGLANLLTTVKKYEYIALIENAYAQIGNKPFKFKSCKDAQTNKEEKEEAAKDFYAFLQNFLEENEVRVHEIPEAFNLNTLSEVSETLEDSAQAQADERLRQSIITEENVMERIFKRSNFMSEYMEVLKDTTDYPIGILWADDKAIKKERVISGGKLKFNKTIQCDVKRVNPCYFWATEDHQLNKPGCAVFKLEQYSSGDLHQWIDKGITGSKKLTENVKEFIDDNEQGYRNESTALFSDHTLLNKGLYDVLVTRGYFSKENVEEENVNIPDEYKYETFVPCEIYFTQHGVLRVRVLECPDEQLGVYTTVFRRNGQGIFGYSLHDFIHPFAKMYEAMVDGIDKNMANSTSSIIQIDRGVIDNPEKYLNKDEKTGDITLDFSEDWIVEFDSSDVFNPNFKGFPIHIDQLPNNLNTLLPLNDFIFREIERLSGIPSILVNSNNISSALRTTKNFNAAFTASAKVIKSLLREGEKRILKPAIQFMFDRKAMSGDMKNFLLDAEPEILLSDTLTREANDDQDLLIGAQTLAQLGGGLIPQERLSALINTVGREVYDLEEDLIPGVSPLATNTPSVAVGSV